MSTWLPVAERPSAFTTMRVASTDSTTPSRLATTQTPESRATSLHARARRAARPSEQRHGLALHVRTHEGAVGVVVLEEGNERRGHDTSWFGETSISVTSRPASITNSPP
jgi:hypothetical protein